MSSNPWVRSGAQLGDGEAVAVGVGVGVLGVTVGVGVAGVGLGVGVDGVALGVTVGDGVAVGVAVGVGLGHEAATKARPRLSAVPGSWSDMAPTRVLAPVRIFTVMRSEVIFDR
jgi:hypothetical protein